ncbi:hypothetical protein HBI80_154060 [Parastagonospora nodorum]|nr:hypothetical protein HBI80_154060 [Parastagonospora nodorum]KAH5994456.1 hypothetical protein HBI82_180500 [Parastagonospora nodorum]
MTILKMSPTMTYAPTTPIPKSTWADDDDDEFDFDTWLATADTSAPLPSSLPPLQLPAADEDEMPFTSTFSTSAPWADSPPNSDTPKPLKTTDWRCGKAMLAWRATQKAPGLPAYVEMSGWDNGVGCEWSRVQYSQHWGNWKVGVGADCRWTAMFKGSLLANVEMVEEEEKVVGEMDAAPNGVGMDTPLTITTTTDALKTLRIPDEGYYTDDSPLVSPTDGASEEGVEVSISTSQVGLATLKKFTRHLRVDSQYALKETKKENEIEIDDGEVAKEGQEIASAGVGGDGGLLDDISIHLSGAAVKSWYYMASQPWTIAGAITSSIVIGGSIYLLRRG